jgi:protocatechuate 3,4-dioxygenase beta subunit
MKLLRIAVLAFLAQNTAVQPRQPNGTASVGGVVIKLGSNNPISGVDLELSGGIQDGTPLLYSAKSSADGKFLFKNIAAGNYRLVAARVGGVYTPVEYGQRGTLGRGIQFPLADGEQKKEIRLEMAPTSSISGRVFDAEGRPVGHAAVMALSPIYKQGRRTLSLVQYIHSDDHGDFRLFSLPPGRYYVAAKPEDMTHRTAPLSLSPPGRVQIAERAETPVVTRRVLPTGDVVEETYRIVYYGGGIDPDLATPIDLGPAANLAGVDIRVSDGVTASRHIRGTSVTAAGTPFPGSVEVRAIPQDWNVDSLIPIATTNATGAFDLAGVVSGKYLLFAVKAADPSVNNSLRMVGVVPVEVGNKDLEGISIVPVPTPNVNGKVVIEGRQANDPAIAQVRVSLNREPNIQVRDLPANYAASVTADGSFSIQSFPADWRLTVDPPTDTYVKSIRIGAKDLLTNNLHIEGDIEGQVQILIGTDGGVLEGKAFNVQQVPIVNATIVLVPEPLLLRQRWDLYKTVPTDLYGRFKLFGIAPGDYKVFAWEEVEENAWTNPQFVAPNEFRGNFVHVEPSGKETLDVTVIPGREANAR